MKRLVGKFNKIINDIQRDIKKYPSIAVLFIILGIPFLVFATYSLSMSVNFINRTVATEGTVVQHRILPGTDDYGTHVYIPVVEFRTNEGQSITFEDGSVVISVGEKVPVRYDLSNPSDARIYSIINFWVGPSTFAVGSAVFSSIGLWGLINKFILTRKSRLKAQAD